MIQSRCKFKIKRRYRSSLGRDIATCLTYTTLVIGLVLMQYDYGKLFNELFMSHLRIVKEEGLEYKSVINANLKSFLCEI